mmetsp:Transcript_1646/g.2113  ORF Transcript_1646/g.2113 Transcript_1646/m.2113 type:complete len:201 (-) Transcript_1646:404-1006(-)
MIHPPPINFERRVAGQLVNSATAIFITGKTRRHFGINIERTTAGTDRRRPARSFRQFLTLDVGCHETKRLTGLPPPFQRVIHIIIHKPRRSHFLLFLRHNRLVYHHLSLFLFFPLLLFLLYHRRSERKRLQLHIRPRRLERSNIILLQRFHYCLPRHFVHREGLVRREQMRRDSPRSKPLEGLSLRIARDFAKHGFTKFA